MPKVSDNESCIDCKNKSACFEKLTDKELQIVSDSKLQNKFKKGEILRKQGSFVSSVLFLKQGYVKVYKEFDPPGQNAIVHFHKPGTLVGLMDVLGDNSVKHTAVALTDCQVCCINIGLFEKLLKENGEYATEVIRTINGISNELIDYQLENNHKQLHGRVARAFLVLAEQVFESNTFGVYLSRNDIAEFTNMSSMSVVRILKEFKEDKLIDDKNGYIKLLNVEKLEMISKLG
jgi:CRP/FNR family transcriptional regulator, polysaccharide utilization system transcription regulator